MKNEKTVIITEILREDGRNFIMNAYMLLVKNGEKWTMLKD